MENYRKYFKTNIVPCQVIDQGLKLTYDLSKLTSKQAYDLYKKGCKYLVLTEEGERRYLPDKAEEKGNPEGESFSHKAVESISVQKNAPPATPKKQSQKKK